MTTEPLLSVSGLTKHFPVKRGIVFQSAVGTVRAVDGLSFDVAPGETLVVEKGSVIERHRLDALREARDLAACSLLVKHALLSCASKHRTGRAQRLRCGFLVARLDRFLDGDDHNRKCE